MCTVGGLISNLLVLKSKMNLFMVHLRNLLVVESF
jgi:hypothetical protein